MVHGITLGFNTDFDPAASMFNTDELPWRVERSAGRRARDLRRADRPRVHRHQPAVLDGGTGQYVELGAEHARGRLQGLRHVRAGHVEGEAEPHADRRPPLRHPDAVRAVHERDVGGHDGQRLRARRAWATAASTAGATSCSPDASGGVVAAVHPARERHRGLQDRPEQPRAVGQHRLAAERAVRVPAHDPRRPRPGDAPRRLLRGLRPAGAHPVHRPLRRQPWRIHLAQPERQHRPGAGGRVVAGAAVADQSPLSRVVQSRSDLSDRRRREPGRQRQRVRAGHPDRARRRPGRSASRGRSRRTWRSRSATSATAATTSGRRSTTTRSAARTWSPTASSTSSSWRWRTSRRTTHRARRTGSARSPTSDRAPARPRCRSTWPTSMAEPDAGNPAAYVNASTTLGELDDRRPARRAEPEPDRRGRRSRRQPDAPQPGAARSATRRTSSSSTPTWPTTT